MHDFGLRDSSRICFSWYKDIHKYLIKINLIMTLLILAKVFKNNNQQ